MWIHNSIPVHPMIWAASEIIRRTRNMTAQRINNEQRKNLSKLVQSSHQEYIRARNLEERTIITNANRAAKAETNAKVLMNIVLEHKKVVEETGFWDGYGDNLRDTPIVGSKGEEIANNIINEENAKRSRSQVNINVILATINAAGTVEEAMAAANQILDLVNDEGTIR